MSKPTTFAEIATTARRRKRGCYACGDDTTAQVSLALRGLGPTKASNGPQITSWTRSLCEPCAVAFYVNALEALESVR